MIDIDEKASSYFLSFFFFLSFFLRKKLPGRVDQVDQEGVAVSLLLDVLEVLLGELVVQRHGRRLPTTKKKKKERKIEFPRSKGKSARTHAP
jgi:hypothetical protein